MTVNDLAFCGVANLVHTDGVASTKSASYGLASGANEPGTRSSAGEHALHTGGVVGSIPTASTIRGLWPDSGFIYIVQAEATGLVKIGMAAKPSSRLRSLQGGCPDRLIVIALIRSDNAAGLEAELHLRFREFRRHGEWFAAADDLLDFAYEHRRPRQIRDAQASINAVLDRRAIR